MKGVNSKVVFHYNKMHFLSDNYHITILKNHPGLIYVMTHFSNYIKALRVYVEPKVYDFHCIFLKHQVNTHIAGI